MRFLIPQAVMQSAQRFPDEEAIRFSSRSLTYSELDSHSNSLARVLKEQGVQRGDRVGRSNDKQSTIWLHARDDRQPESKPDT